MSQPERISWKRVTTRDEFVSRFAGVTLVADGLRFVIHDDGRIVGDLDGLPLSGCWYWEDGFFCRTADLDGTPLELDCEIIECRGDQMRYIRERGNGEASIVEIDRA